MDSVRANVADSGLATWDAPPREGDPGYEAFHRAFVRFVQARSIPKPTGPRGLAKGKRPKNHYKKHCALEKDGVLDLGQDPQYKLMDFQVCSFIRLILALLTL
jgi:chromodomain-helicase-DNA-binding protein 4